jgi:hypothetical protein
MACRCVKSVFATGYLSISTCGHIDMTAGYLKIFSSPVGLQAADLLNKAPCPSMQGASISIPY